MLAHVNPQRKPSASQARLIGWIKDAGASAAEPCLSLLVGHQTQGDVFIGFYWVLYGFYAI